MVVETSTRKQTFAGAQTTLTFTFRALTAHPEFIKVKKLVVATQVESDLVYNTDYTVSISTTGIGGTVTLTPTFSTAFNFVVYRETSLTQSSDYDDYNQFPANTLENNLDMLTMIAQEQSEELDRTTTLPISSTAATTTVVFPTPESDKIIGWNTAATALENKTVLSLSAATQASTAEAQAGTNNTNFMTPFLVKTEVEFPGAVLIPAANVVTGSTANITVTNATITTATIGTATITTATITNLTTSTINITTLRVGSPTTGTILIHNGTSFAANNGLQGNAGQALLSNGGGVAPSFGTISSGLSFVSTTTASTVTGTSISISNTKRYKVYARFRNYTNNGSTFIRFNNDSGANYQYCYSGISAGPTTNSTISFGVTGATNIIHGVTHSVSTSAQLDLEFTIHNQGPTALVQPISGNATANINTASYGSVTTWMGVWVSGTVTASTIQLIFDAGTADLKIDLYEIV